MLCANAVLNGEMSLQDTESVWDDSFNDIQLLSWTVKSFL